MPVNVYFNDLEINMKLFKGIPLGFIAYDTSDECHSAVYIAHVPPFNAINVYSS